MLGNVMLYWSFSYGEKYYQFTFFTLFNNYIIADGGTDLFVQTCFDREGQCWDAWKCYVVLIIIVWKEVLSVYFLYNYTNTDGDREISIEVDSYYA